MKSGLDQREPRMEICNGCSKGSAECDDEGNRTGIDHRMIRRSRYESGAYLSASVRRLIGSSHVIIKSPKVASRRYGTTPAVLPLSTFKTWPILGRSILFHILALWKVKIRRGKSIHVCCENRILDTKSKYVMWKVKRASSANSRGKFRSMRQNQCS